MKEIKKEVVRKLLHFLGICYIPAYDILGKEMLAIGLVTVIITLVFFEILRIKHRFLPEILLRKYEKRGIGAHIYMFTGMLVITLLFSKQACFAGVACAIIGDGVAGIVKKMPAKRFSFLVMFLASFATCVILNLNTLCSLFACFFATLIEGVQKVGRAYLNDNFSIPVFAAFGFTLCGKILK